VAEFGQTVALPENFDWERNTLAYYATELKRFIEQAHSVIYNIGR
jgi:hypothetical protein